MGALFYDIEAMSGGLDGTYIPAVKVKSRQLIRLYFDMLSFLNWGRYDMT
jgi:hypothetical protein